MGKYVGVMYPTTWPKRVDDAHCTLLFLGKVEDADFTKEDVQEALDSVDFLPLGEIKVSGTEFFGPGSDIPVVRLESVDNLISNRYQTLLALMKRGITTKSDFLEFKPHVTVDTFDDLDIPDTIFLEDKPVVWWDE